MRATFAAFAMIEVETSYSISTKATGRAKPAGKLIITNVPTLFTGPAAND